MDNIRSSYIENDYGSVFRSLILAQQPRLVVELGVLDGFSSFHIADSLKFNKERLNIQSEFFAYDLWEDYDYKHGDFQEVEDMLKSQGLDKYCNLTEGDAFEVAEVFSNESINLIHLDISNNGDIIRNIIKLWNSKILKNGIILIEGGSIERDEVEWMIKHKKEPIRPVLENDNFLNENYNWMVLESFPSMTLLIKK